MAKQGKLQQSRQERLAAVLNKLKNTDIGGGGGAGFWSPKEGKSIIRILPGIGDMGDIFFQTVGRHTFPGDGKKYCYCPKFTSEGEYDCPVCDLVDELKKRPDKASQKLADELRMRKMYWMNIVVRGRIDPKTREQVEPDQGPFVYTPGVSVFGDIVGLVSDSDYGDIYDPDEGIDITIDRKGTGIDTEYSVNPRRQSTPLSDDPDQAQEWLDKARDLSYVMLSDDPEEDKATIGNHAVYILPYDRLSEEMELDADEEEDDAEPPARKPQPKPAASRKPSKVVEEEEEEEEEEVEEEEEEEVEEEEDEPPAKKVQARMARRRTR